MSRNECSYGAPAADVHADPAPGGNRGGGASSEGAAPSMVVRAAPTEQPDEFAQLLDDVRRIADGIDGVAQIAGRVAEHVGAWRNEQTVAADRALITALRLAYDAARTSREYEAKVSIDALRVAIARLENLTEGL